MPTESDVPGEQVWPTQPIPHNAPRRAADSVSAPPFHSSQIRKRRSARGQIYTPYSVNEFYIVAHGGSSWGPLSFSPRPDCYM